MMENTHTFYNIKFPIQIIALERCSKTLDTLFIHGTLSDNEWITDAVSTTLPGTSDPVLDFTERNPFGEPTENT